MHGIILVEMERFIAHRFGTSAWSRLLSDAGLSWRVYSNVQDYPDEEVVALVGAAAKLSGQPAGTLLEELGEALVPGLVATYGALIRPNWGALDLIANTENAIHRVVRMRNPGARPPELECIRRSPEELVILYRSKRRLCSVAKGICRGIIGHYGERIAIAEPSCMLTGQPSCEIVLTAAC